MSQVPSQDEQPLCRCRTLYLGTSLFDPSSRKFAESNLSLNQLQDTISKRYPVDGSNFAKGIETWLSIFPSGVQMEHSSSKDVSEISGLFYYPIKSLVYCGALRLALLNVANAKASKFVPLDSELAQLEENIKNPPLFVIFLKAIDSNTKKEIIECHVFVVGLKKTSMKLIESCQKAFSLSKVTVSQFYKKYGNVPVVYCLKNQLADKNDKRVVVKTHDPDGYFYATETTPIDCWQLFETNDSPPIIYETSIQSQHLPNINTSAANNTNTMGRSSLKKNNNKNDNMMIKSNEIDMNDEPSPNKLEPLAIDPYEPTDNLVRVEKRVDPNTGQTIFIRWIKDDRKSSTDDLENNNYDMPELLYSDGTLKKYDKNTPIIIREDTRTPSPIIVEKYITKKSPQIIIKEIHVNEPAPPPYKVIQNIDGSLPYPISQQQNQIPTQQTQQRMPPAPPRQTSPYNNILNSPPRSPNRNNNLNGSMRNLNNPNIGNLMRRNPNMPPPLTPPPPAYNPNTGNRIIYNSFKAPTKPVGRYTPPMSSLPPQLEYKSNNDNNSYNNNNNNNNPNYSNFYSMNQQNYNTIRSNNMNNHRPSHAHSMNKIYNPSTPPPPTREENVMIPKNSNFYSMQPSISSEIKKYARHSYAYPQDFESPIQVRNKKYGYAASKNNMMSSKDNLNDSTYDKINNKPGDRENSIIHQRTAIIDTVVEKISNKSITDNKNNNNNHYYTDTIKNDNRHFTDSIRRQRSKHDHHNLNHPSTTSNHYRHHHHHHSSQRNLNDNQNLHEQSRMLPHRINQFNTYSKQEIDKLINGYR